MQATNSDYNDKKVAKALAKDMQEVWKDKVERSLYLSKNCGNSYTASLYFCLMSLLCDPEVDLTNKRILMFSYGSGCAASMFTIRVNQEYGIIKSTSDFNERLDSRNQKTPEEYEA
jgi:hydroxymethylglutaryl-CoA synthase